MNLFSPGPAKRAAARAREVACAPPRPALDVGAELALELAEADRPDRAALWEALAAFLPASIASPPAPTAGWIVSVAGMLLERYDPAIARDALQVRAQEPIELVPRRRHPSESRRGALQYHRRLWLLGRRAEIEARTAASRTLALGTGTT